MTRGPRSVRKLALTILGLTVAVTGLWLALAVTSGPAVEGEVRIEIPKGTSGHKLVSLLEGAGLTTRPTITYWLMRYEGTFPEVQAGIHLLPANASPLMLATLLKRPPALPQISLTLIPGETVWQAAARFEAAGLGGKDDLLRLAADRAYVSQLGLPVGPERAAREDGVAPTYLEGFLTPETHFFAPDATLEHVVTTLTEPFKAMWHPLVSRRKSDLMVLKETVGLTPSDIVTLASLVEREAKVKAEAAAIAGVFMNRLRVGMRLQTDPTLIYHPDRIGEVPTPTHRKDATNPYNTYAHSGLPPGPVCSPTRHTIEATLAPDRHNYLYFCARQDGSGRHAFARNIEEHEVNIRRYLRKN